jgi:hypothetical protein
MIEQEPFFEGLVRIGIAVRQPADAATLRVYHDALKHETTAEEWDVFTRQAVVGGVFDWFPKVKELVGALGQFRGELPIEAEAGAAYDRVVECRSYAPQGGGSWNFRQVQRECGQAAAAAFLAAGGHHAFATTYRESERRAAFIASYVRAARADKGARLLPQASERPALPPARSPLDPEHVSTWTTAPPEQSGGFSAAGSALREIDLAGEPADDHEAEA